MTSLFVFVRFLSEDALWLGLAGLVLSVFTTISEPLVPLWILSFSMVLAELCGKKVVKARLFALIPMATVFFFCKSVGDWVLLLPIFAYNAKCIFKENIAPNATESYYRFRMVAILGFVGGFLCVIAKLKWGFVFCMLSIMCHLFMTRMLRHTSADLQDKKLLMTEAVFLIIVALIVFGLSSDVFLQASFATVKWIYLEFIAPILVILAYLLMGVMMVVSWVFSLFLDGNFEGFDTGSMQEMMVSLPLDMEEAEASGGNPWFFLLLKVGGIILFFLVAYVILRFAAQEKAAKMKESANDIESVGTLDGTSSRFVNTPVSFLDRSPEAGVRRAYLNFCRWYDNYIGTIHPSSTTRSLNRSAFEEENEAANELRSLYLRARYTGKSGLTSEDARRAGTLAKTIIKANR